MADNKNKQLYGWFSQKQLEIITNDNFKGCERCSGVPTYYIENGNKIICTMVSRDPEEHGTTFKDIQFLGKVYRYAGFYKDEFCNIETLNKEALNI